MLKSVEKSNKLFDFAITISLYSTHKLNKFLYKDNLSKSNIKRIFNDLELDEQVLYLINLFSFPLLARNISYLYACERHTNITLKDKKLKYHLHGTIKNITMDTMAELKTLYLKNYIKVSTDKAILDCFKCVPIVNSGWADYIEKEQADPKYILDLLNHLESDYLHSNYCFGCIKKYLNID